MCTNSRSVFGEFLFFPFLSPVRLYNIPFVREIFSKGQRTRARERDQIFFAKRLSLSGGTSTALPGLPRVMKLGQKEDGDEKKKKGR